MEHPFVGDISHLTMEELMEKINTLNNKLAFAHRMGNYGMVNQINMVLENYRREVGKKQAEMFDTNTPMISGKIDIN
jgi:uncharacterized membrane protein (DUF106 family)